VGGFSQLKTLRHVLSRADTQVSGTDQVVATDSDSSGDHQVMGDYAKFDGEHPTMKTVVLYGTLETEVTRAQKGGADHSRWVTCQVLSTVNPVDCSRPGDSCSATVHNELVNGYCHRVDEQLSNTLACGRLVPSTTIGGMDPATKRRCPDTTPDTPQGNTVIVQTLKTIGCLDSADPSYDHTVYYHDPQSCSGPSPSPHAVDGCTRRNALNYSPGSTNPRATCHFSTEGCTDPTAANYNEWATINDGTCVTKVPGCPVHPTGYFGIDENTPGYNGRTVGSELPAQGEHVYPSYLSVLPHTIGVMSPDPNFDDGSCIVAIEGCMDSSALNYNQNATMNTNSWCIPRIVGCMLPGVHPLPGMLGYPTVAAGAANYDPRATEDSGCKPQFFGCMLSSASNYNPHATVNHGCVRGEGCLRRDADNYGCKKRQDPCDDENLADPESLWIAIHAPLVCMFPGDTATSFKLDGAQLDSAVMGAYGAQADDASKRLMKLVVQFVVEGDLNDNCGENSMMPAFINALASFYPDVVAGMTTAAEVAGNTVYSCAAGSTQIAVMMDPPSQAGYEISNYVTVINSAASVTLFENVLGAKFLSYLSAELLSVAVPGEEENNAALIGGVVGGVVGGLLLLGGAVYYFKMKKAKAGNVTPA